MIARAFRVSWPLVMFYRVLKVHSPAATIYHEMHSRLYDFFIGMTADYLRSGFVYRDNLSALSFTEE